ncbi:nitronate monooxygenase [Novosphingobium sp. GV055]|nr:nitronate monooxygenase [Novosphingobium sp. GV055]PTR12571.1 nitronate monooxygenase [Novosphingobium sp. GV055]PUB06355.1 nitronate monooxygenase [Novosphingobium sp. GV061]PUB22406.1 nitronate monooxygenase [Novosphingobium sp. GV079]PUB44431.1 nitronate monooxygenase [Novosphingobium sp. GV027]
MSLRADMRSGLALPAICAPMMLVSGPELVLAACKAGLAGALPWHNARGIEQFSGWLRHIREELGAWREINPAAKIGPVMVNITLKRTAEELAEVVDLCIAHGIRHFITALGNPAEATKLIHDRGGIILHDVTSIRFAEKAIASGVDGLICIGGGGGGHSGTLNPFAFIPAVRSIFDGVIVFAGCVSSGSAIRAAEVLGADLAYLGTRFIAAREARAPDEWKAMLVSGNDADLTYSPAITGVHANWLNASLKRENIVIEDLPPALPAYHHLPEDIRPWRDLWSAGQGINLIHDIPDVATLVARLHQEYAAACHAPDLFPDPAGSTVQPQTVPA